MSRDLHVTPSENGHLWLVTELVAVDTDVHKELIVQVCMTFNEAFEWASKHKD